MPMNARVVKFIYIHKPTPVSCKHLFNIYVVFYSSSSYTVCSLSPFKCMHIILIVPQFQSTFPVTTCIEVLAGHFYALMVATECSISSVRLLSLTFKYQIISQDLMLLNFLFSCLSAHLALFTFEIKDRSYFVLKTLQYLLAHLVNYLPHSVSVYSRSHRKDTTKISLFSVKLRFLSKVLHDPFHSIASTSLPWCALNVSPVRSALPKSNWSSLNIFNNMSADFPSGILYIITSIRTKYDHGHPYRPTHLHFVNFISVLAQFRLNIQNLIDYSTIPFSLSQYSKFSLPTEMIKVLVIPAASCSPPDAEPRHLHLFNYF